MAKNLTPKQIDAKVKKLKEEITQLGILKKELGKVKKLRTVVKRIEHPKRAKRKKVARKRPEKKKE